MEAGRIWGRGVEWDAVRALLAREARTDYGRERALRADPLSDVAAVQSAIDLTREARQALAGGGAPPIDTVPDVRSALARARAEGSVLEGAELAFLIPLLDAGPRLTTWGHTVRPVAPALGTITDSLPHLPDLREALGRSLDDDGAVTDAASPHLGRLRREIRERRRRLVGDLERMLDSRDAEKILADRFVTVRHGRYVLPVRAEARARVPGIVHDRSQSGQTLFIEPTRVVEANNDLVDLLRQEEQETARVLAELTRAVRERADDLEALCDRIGALDWIFARARIAERMNATAPLVDEGQTVSLRNARHPLLLAQQWEDPTRPVVPVDLELGPERPLLVITGPNAGGKTIALKTLALLALMAQVGCHVPADEGSRLPVFDAVWAIIGDEQSVAQNLSTFSAFVTQVRQILAHADPHALVLLDELGAGTDPDEGAALAQAILEALDARGALVIATTHLEPLKAFASTYPHARNASVEFDTASLAPTFRLSYDRPGQSLALAIAARLGLAPDLIARAHTHRSEHAARLADLLARLDAHARSEAERVQVVERRESEAVARLAAAREAEQAAEGRVREILDRARAEGSALLAEVRRAVAREWEALKKGERSRKALETSRRRLVDATARVIPSAADGPPGDPGALRPGARVAAAHLGLEGELVSIAGATATVRSGAITARIPLAALRPIAHAKDRSAAGRGPAPRASVVPSEGAGPRPAAPREIAPELLLLGRTTDEARDAVEKYLDDAFLAGLPTIRLVHGKGTGALRKTVRDLLLGHPLVESFRDGEPSEGGTGATVAALKVS
ncbi:MAG: endonuclease MutS2 [Candidatus Rokubacteria bacterium]|nr:endonuclease MutS2 [Candidatus Rokubacteria bacterium]